LAEADVRHPWRWFGLGMTKHSLDLPIGLSR